MIAFLLTNLSSYGACKLHQSAVVESDSNPPAFWKDYDTQWTVNHTINEEIILFGRVSLPEPAPRVLF